MVQERLKHHAIVSKEQEISQIIDLPSDLPEDLPKLIDNFGYRRS